MKIHEYQGKDILRNAGIPVPNGIPAFTVQEAVEAGGSTLRDFRQTDGDLGYFQHAFRVYGREGEPCVKPACQGVVQRIVQAGRSTFFCPSCQR